MSYSPYYVSILNFINGRPLSEPTPPDSTTAEEKSLMALAYSSMGLLSEKDIQSLTLQLKKSTKTLYQEFQRSHGEYDLLRKNGFVLHHVETLWLDALDKALPYIENALAAEDTKVAKLSPKELKEIPSASPEVVHLHALLVALIQFAVRDLHYRP